MQTALARRKGTAIGRLDCPFVSTLFAPTFDIDLVFVYGSWLGLKVKVIGQSQV